MAGDSAEHASNSHQATEVAARPAQPYRADDRDAAWNRRRDDRHQLAAVAADLDDVDIRAAALNDEVTRLLDSCAAWDVSVLDVARRPSQSGRLVHPGRHYGRGHASDFPAADPAVTRFHPFS